MTPPLRKDKESVNLFPRQDEAKTMPEPNEQTLFDGLPAPSAPETNQVSFGVALLALGLAPGLGQVGIGKLVAEYEDDLGRIFWQSRRELAEIMKDLGLRDPVKLSETIADKADLLIKQGSNQWNVLQSRRVSVIPPSKIPDRLKDLDADAPRWLFVQGSVDVLSRRPIIAVVGTRKPTLQGKRAAEMIAKVLSPYPVTIVSGLADGIDAAAHDFTLRRDLKNIAFLGHGINIIFPEQTSGLREKIVEAEGAVVSEYLPHQSYQKQQFVRRNRLQAALADIIIPVEGNLQSGTMHTVRYAREYGRTLVGMRWEGRNGIVSDLAEHGDRVIDIFTPRGQQELDSIVQKLVEDTGEEPYLRYSPLSRPKIGKFKVDYC
jgi:DNA protecting protein DprA